MRYLLDTHAFNWWASEPEKLFQRALNACLDPQNTLSLSVASVWEMQIKMQLGKLQLDNSLKKLITAQQQSNTLQILSIEVPHVLALSRLPMYHKDPFDRLLVAQAMTEELVLISADSAFSLYAATLLW